MPTPRPPPALGLPRCSARAFAGLQEGLLSLLTALRGSPTQLSVLCLGSAGRGFGGACAQLLSEGSGASGSFRVQHLSLGGAYRLGSAALCALLSDGPFGGRLRTLQLTYSPLVDAAVTAAIGAACAGLHSLALDHCAALDDGGLAQLGRLRALRELSLAGLPRLSAEGLVQLLAGGAEEEGGASLGGGLELLSLAENEQLTDEPIIALAAHCVASLHTLDLSGLHALTDQAVGACVLQAGQLRCLRLRGLHKLSDEPVVLLAQKRGAGLAELSLNGCALISDQASDQRARALRCSRAPRRPAHPRAAHPAARPAAPRRWLRSRRTATAGWCASTSRGAARSPTTRSAGWRTPAWRAATGRPSARTGRCSTGRAGGRCCRASSCGA